MRFLRAFLIFLRGYRFREEAEWKRVDQKGLEAFLATNSGQKMLDSMRNRSIALNSAALFSKGSPYDSGFANGYAHLLAWFEALSSVSAQPEESPASTNDPEPWDEAGLSHLVP